MSRPLIVLRPEPGCSETVAAARSRDLRVVASPLFEIEAVEWPSVDARDFDAIIAGSANAFRYGGGRLASLTAMPVYSVGRRTADAAREAGFEVAEEGEGGLQSLLEKVSRGRRLLRLAGESRIVLTPPPGTTILERVVYRAIPLPLAGEAAAELTGGAVALLHSGEAARCFSKECQRLALDRRVISIAALAPRIAQEAGDGWQEVRVTAKLADSALLALAEDMCQ